jgi:hypothetical protein
MPTRRRQLSWTPGTRLETRPSYLSTRSIAHGHCHVSRKSKAQTHGAVNPKGALLVHGAMVDQAFIVIRKTWAVGRYLD